MAWQVTGNHPRDYQVEDGIHAIIHVLDPEMPEQHLPDFRGEIINCITDPKVSDVEVDLDYGLLNAPMLSALVKAQQRANVAEKELTISHISNDGHLILEATGLTALFNLHN